MSQSSTFARVLVGPADLVPASESESLHRRLRADLKVTELFPEGRVRVGGDEYLLYRIASALRFESVRIRVRGSDVLVALASLARCLRAVVPAGVDLPPEDICRDVMDAEGVQLEMDSSRGCFIAPDDDAVALLCAPDWTLLVASGRVTIKFERLWQSPSPRVLLPLPTPSVEPATSLRGPTAVPSAAVSAVPASAAAALATRTAAPVGPDLAHVPPPSVAPVLLPTPPPPPPAGQSLPTNAPSASASAPAPTARPAPHELTDVHILHDAENCRIPKGHAVVSGARLWQAVVREAYAALCGLSASAASALDLGRLLSPQWTFVLPSHGRMEPASTTLSDLRSCGGFEHVDAGA